MAAQVLAKLEAGQQQAEAGQLDDGAVELALSDVRVLLGQAVRQARPSRTASASTPWPRSVRSEGGCDTAAIVSGIETARGLLVGIGALAAIIADLATTGGLITLATLSFSSSYRPYLRNDHPTFWLADPQSGIAVESPFQLEAGRWHHLVARYGGARLAISVAGQETAVDHQSSIPITPIWLEIGSTPFRNEFFIGTIDELVISGR